ncbi:hypothetical protein CDAR_199401 [Caerostris darwini]|uniref:Secreted protein n=1 Tax=Caerostris darwini TaxID=1538125 RepID=A0AAV4X220_9ARAC|nr:hypothetical protein CDAR_199401 [Caerostris darwini]
MRCNLQVTYLMSLCWPLCVDSISEWAAPTRRLCLMIEKLPAHIHPPFSGLRFESIISGNPELMPDEKDDNNPICYGLFGTASIIHAGWFFFVSSYDRQESFWVL